MQDPPVAKTKLLAISVICLLTVVIYFLINQLDPHTKIVFCDVGQGDAAYIRVKNKIDILIDTGPDRKILQCLSRYMAFFDRKIEYAIITHPQKDHYGGLSYLLDRYKIDNLLMTRTKSLNSTFNSLLIKIIKQKINIILISNKQKLNILGDYLTLYLPQTSPSNNIIDPNELALISLFQENKTKILFTSDLPKFTLGWFLDSNLTIRNINILKVPHHGSKNGLSRKILQLADPRLSVISVGKNNIYGHPAKEVLDMFKALKMKYLRTDEIGNIEIKLRE